MKGKRADEESMGWSVLAWVMEGEETKILEEEETSARHKASQVGRTWSPWSVLSLLLSSDCHRGGRGSRVIEG